MDFHEEARSEELCGTGERARRGQPSVQIGERNRFWTPLRLGNGQYEEEYLEARHLMERVFEVSKCCTRTTNGRG